MLCQDLQDVFASDRTTDDGDNQLIKWYVSCFVKFCFELNDPLVMVGSLILKPVAGLSDVHEWYRFLQSYGAMVLARRFG